MMLHMYVSHKAAMDKCITWLREATPYNTSVLLSLKEIAANKDFHL